MIYSILWLVVLFLAGVSYIGLGLMWQWWVGVQLHWYLMKEAWKRKWEEVQNGRS